MRDMHDDYPDHLVDAALVLTSRDSSDVEVTCEI